MASFDMKLKDRKRQLISGPKSEPGTARIQKSATHYSTTHDDGNFLNAYDTTSFSRWTLMELVSGRKAATVSIHANSTLQHNHIFPLKNKLDMKQPMVVRDTIPSENMDVACRYLI
jgi:hypothetical protein